MNVNSNSRMEAVTTETDANLELIETIAFRGQLRNGSLFYAKRGSGNFSLAEGRGGGG